MHRESKVAPVQQGKGERMDYTAITITTIVCVTLIIIAIMGKRK